MNVRKLRPYFIAENLKWEQKNREFHLMGQYVYDAVTVALYNAFRKSGKQPLNYPEHPYKFMSAEEKKDYIERESMERAKAEFMAFAKGLENKLKKGGEDNG